MEVLCPGGKNFLSAIRRWEILFFGTQYLQHGSLPLFTAVQGNQGRRVDMRYIEGKQNKK